MSGNEKREPLIQVQNLGKSFGNIEVLKDITVDIYKGDVVFVVGPSGSGKSTFLRCLNRLEEPTKGHIYFEGTDITDPKTDIDKHRQKMGMVFQQFNLFPHMDIMKNLTLAPMKLQGKSQQEAEAEAMRLLERVGLADRAHAYPSQLSGGQRQRVAFARALAPNPQVLLLDEPFAAIDAKIRQELRSWLKEMIGKLGITSIFVTHDQDEAIEVADEIIITNAGRIEQKGTPIGVYRNPETAFTASFFGQPSILKNADDFHTFTQAEGADKIIVRPEFVKVSRLDEVEKFRSSVSQGVVERVSFRGDNLELQVRVNNSVVTARRSLEKADIREGETVNVFLYRIFALRGDSVQLIENEAVRDDFVII